MKILIAEDDFAGRRILQVYLSPFGQCDLAAHGREAVAAFRLACQENAPYDLLCLDIMMPEMDGQAVLKRVREIERERGVAQRDEVKVIMTTALNSPRDVIEAFYRSGCTSYLVKPIERSALEHEVRSLFPEWSTSS